MKVRLMIEVIESIKEPELTGGFDELAKKGIKIKDYKEKIPRPKNESTNTFMNPKSKED
jgi:hypothetical protein